MTATAAEPVLNLTFHGLGEPRRNLEPGEREVWLDESGFISLLDAARGRQDVRITFDDGNVSDFEIGFPALAERGMTAAFFVVADRVDKPGFMDQKQLKTLMDAGMEIGSHGLSHRPWRDLEEAELDRELRGAKDMLENVIGRAVEQAACPFGSYGRRVLGGLRAAGFKTVYTSDRGWAWRDQWLQARNTLHQGDGPEILAAIGAPGEEGIGRRLRLAVKRWR